jgi:hypothetical protein
MKKIATHQYSKKYVVKLSTSNPFLTAVVLNKNKAIEETIYRALIFLFQKLKGIITIYEGIFITILFIYIFAMTINKSLVNVKCYGL